MKKKNLILTLCLFIALAAVCSAVLFADSYPDTADSSQSRYSISINEICSKNDSIIADNEGKFRDYIELHNSGEAVCLEGFTLNDGKVSCSPFGSMILGKDEYLLVFLGDELTGFALGASGGDCIQLLDSEGGIVAQATTAALLSDQVMLFNGGIYENSYDASPGYANSAAGISAFLKGSETVFSELVISEVLIGNESSLPDENGLYSDIIELHNIGSDSVNLRHYCLSDDSSRRHRFRLPDRELAPDDRILIFCDGANYISESGEIHANFAISHGEMLTLTNQLGEYSILEAQFLGDDISLALTDDSRYAAAAVSLGFENSEIGSALFASERINSESALVISEVLLSSAGVPYGGMFTDLVEIFNRSAESVSTEGWYLSDGGDPYEYPLPKQTLAPGEYLVVECSAQTSGFALSDGETLRLTAPDHCHAPTVSCNEGESGKSINIYYDSDQISCGFAEVSIAYPNTADGRESYFAARSADGLIISEVMSANRSYLKGPYGTTADWLELHNTSDSTVELADYYLSDRSSDTDRYPLPDITLKAGEYCVLLLKSDPTNLNSHYESLPFNLSSEGEQLYLSKNGSVVDYVMLPELAADESWGRAKESSVFSLLASPTPGYGNSASAEKCAMPTASVAQGCYDGIDYLDIELSGEGEIYYTTSCATPGSTAKLYTGPIRLTETTVIRAECRSSGKQDSELLNLSYIINENDTLPIVSVVTDPGNLWDPGNGIYVAGPDASEEPPHFGANYWNDWEKIANITLFETDGSGFSADCGIKIFGGFTRSMPKKSLACHFRDIYGCGELAYPLFGEDSFDTYESFVLRTGGQDSTRARMRDVLITSLFSDYTDVPVQKYKPVVVYLNGEYWGLHYIREKINTNYLAAHYNVEPDTLNVVKGGGWANPDYVDFAEYTAKHNMSDPEQYEYVSSRIDVDNYIDFLIAEMWIANMDSGNVKYFLNPEGIWTWILYDTDLAFLEYKNNPFPTYFLPNNIGAADTTAKTFGAKMIKNELFRDKFLSRMAWQMNTIWTEENINARIDEIITMIGEDMPKECERWNNSYKAWQDSVESLRLFAANRNEYMLKFAQEWFDLTDKEMRSYGFDI